MEERKKLPAPQGGKFLHQRERAFMSRSHRGYPGRGRWVAVMVLLCWDGLLLYMILRCLIDPVYGAVFVAGVSVCLGYQL